MPNIESFMDDFLDRVNKVEIEFEIEKGGEGSRGGKVIGHTKSGKPVYASGEKGNDYSQQDHLDASYVHDKIGDTYRKTAKEAGKGSPTNVWATETAEHHNFQSNKHQDQATRAQQDKYRQDDGKREYTERAPKNHEEWLTRALAKGGGEGSRGGNVIGHTASGKAIYSNSHEFEAPHKDHATGGSKGWGAIGEQAYHDHMSGYHTARASNLSQDGFDKEAAKHKDAAVAHKMAYNALESAIKEPKASGGTYRTTTNAEYMRSAMRNARIDSDKLMTQKSNTVEAIELLKKHAPTGGGMFGSATGASMTGFGVGEQVGSEAASGQPEAPHAAVGLGQRAIAGLASTAGGSKGSAGAHGSAKSHNGSCKACEAGECKDHMDKAITSRALVIPSYMKGPHYDPQAIERSATAQTSKMYTSLAPPVRDTIKDVGDSEDLRLHRVAEDIKRSQEVADFRTKIHRAVCPRGDIRFGR